MTLTDYAYQCSGGESFDSVALEVYGDEKYAAELLNANPELGNKLVFQGGETIALPQINLRVNSQTGQQISAAPWKEG